jgi:predicted nucleic acid-binding protein
MDVLTDTGVLLRLAERTDPQHAAIRHAVRTVRGRGDRLVAAPQNVAEVWNVCTRPVTARGGFGLSVDETDRRVRLIERLVRILPDSADAYGHWRRLVVAHSIQGVQVHDARLVAWMLSRGVTCLLTRNGPDFARYPGITVLAPADLAGTP